LKQIIKIGSAILLCFSLMTGCAMHQVQAPTKATLTSVATQKKLKALNKFAATGKVGFSDGERGGNATLRWEQEGNDYQLRLYGPLGSGSIKIVGQAGSVYLVQSNGQTVTAKTPEALVQRELGWTIPVSGLRYWLRGIPTPGTPSKMKYNENGELESLEQQGWTVYYQSYQDIQGLRLPYKLLLQNGPIRLKFIFHEWQFLY